MFNNPPRSRRHAPPGRRLARALTGVIVLAGTFATVATVAPAPAAADEAPADGSDPGEFSVAVDESIVPVVPIKDLAGTTATVVGPGGTAADFVSGRLVLVTDDRQEVENVAARLGAKPRLVTDPTEAIARLDEKARGAADEQLGAVWALDFQPDHTVAKAAPELLARATGDVARGAYGLSSWDGLATIAQAAQLRLEGVPVELDFVLGGETFRDFVTTESPTQPGLMGTNSSTWAHLTQLRVPQAWNLLARAGLLNANSIRVAVLDGGFGSPDADRAPSAIADPSQPNSVPCSGGTACPFHGANVASVLMAVPDNSFGSAGPAGPVATPILIDRAAVFTDVLAGYFRAVGAGARVINMSFGADIPAVAAVFTGSIDATMSATRAGGVLNVAAAGNSSKDIDRTDCFITCWEAETVLPCEATGVVCVGGVQFNTNMPDPGSNWGSGGLQAGNSVDLWASFTALAGPDPGFTGNRTQFARGTSIASPLVAGAAALARTASQGASVPTIESVLANTAASGTCSAPGRCASRIVNAEGAVGSLLGNLPPDVRITPTGGASTPRGVPVTFTAQAFDPNGTTPSVTWFVDGAFAGTGTTLTTSGLGLPYGNHQVRAEAFDGQWRVGDAAGGVVLTTYNTPPTTRITTLADGSTIYDDGTSCANPWRLCYYPTLGADTTDVNEPNGISRAWGRWEIDGAIVAYGHDASLPPLAVGAHTIRFVVSDTAGSSASHQITINVIARFRFIRPPW